jgi:hypothetical protein
MQGCALSRARTNDPLVGRDNGSAGGTESAASTLTSTHKTKEFSVALKDRFPRSSEPNEGKVTQMTESQTSRIPSLAFLSAAVGSMVASAALQAKGNERMSLFVGQWVPTFLMIGLYNKIVKVAGHD